MKITKGARKEKHICCSPFSYFSFQLIFRKVSDVRRERELEEKRKHEPLQEISQDHLVRKLFSRFRRNGGDKHGASINQVHHSDVEKGASEEHTNHHDGRQNLPERAKSKTVNISEHGDKVAPLVSNHKSTRWAALLGNSSSLGSSCGGAVPDNFEEEDDEDIPDGPQNQELVTVKSESLHVVRMTPDPPPDSGSLPMLNKWRMSTVQEGRETSSNQSSTYYRSDDDVAREQFKDGKKFGETSSNLYSRAALVDQNSLSQATLEIQQVSANMMDFKVDMKLEIQRMNNKIGKLENHLLEILKHVSSSTDHTISSPRTEVCDTTARKISDDTSASVEISAENDEELKSTEENADSITEEIEHADPVVLSPEPSSSDTNTSKPKKVLVQSCCYTPRTSPTASTVRAMLESEIDDQDIDQEDSASSVQEKHEHSD